MNLQVSSIILSAQTASEDGKAEKTKFKWPNGVCRSNDGKIYVTDSRSYSIRMILNGKIYTIAGCRKEAFKDGKVEDAMFRLPTGICTSSDGKIYVADTYSHRIRMISDGMVSTIAGCGQPGWRDGQAKTAQFYNPRGICISNEGKIYVADTDNNCIRMISNGFVTTIAGCGTHGFQDGRADSALFNNISGICVSADDDLYVSDSHNDRIRMISDGIVSTVAGCGKQGFEDGNAQDAMLNNPSGVCIADDGRIYFSDKYNHRIRMISHGNVSTIAGSGEKGCRDGKPESAMFDDPRGLCISDDGNIYVIDRGYCVRMISGLSTSYFELSSLLRSKSLSDMTLTINNHQYHLHTTVIYALFPMLVQYISIIEDAKISNESLQTMFEMIYSNNTIKIRKQKEDQYEMVDLTHLLELIWLFDSFEINNESFVATCIKQFKMRLKHLMKQEEEQQKTTIETFLNELAHRTNEMLLLNKLHGLQTTKLVEIYHLINQNKQNENQQEESSNTYNHEILTISIHEMFLLLGIHTEPRVVDQQQIKSTITKSALKTQPDYTIMTHDRSYSIKCHKVILYAKWSYFRRLIESGLLESASGEMIMPEDWNATRLYDFVRYLYTHEVGFESVEDSQWLLNNADMYELIEITRNKENVESKISKRDYQSLIETCSSRLETFRIAE